MKTCWTGIPEEMGAGEETTLDVVGEIAGGAVAEGDDMGATAGATVLERDVPPQPARSASARTRGCRFTGPFSWSKTSTRSTKGATLPPGEGWRERRAGDGRPVMDVPS